MHENHTDLTFLNVGRRRADILLLDAYRRGAREADEEFKDGYVTVYTYGLRDWRFSFSEEDYLPYRGIAGCIVNKETRDYADGHNDRVESNIKKGKIPANSLKRYVDVIADPSKQTLIPLARIELGDSRDIEGRTVRIDKNDSGHISIFFNSGKRVWETPISSDQGDFEVGVSDDGLVLILKSRESIPFDGSIEECAVFDVLDGLGGIRLSYDQVQLHQEGEK